MGIKTTVAQLNFSAGQMSPKMNGRFDLDIYLAGCQKIQNFIPYFQGPARFREGTYFVEKTEAISTLVPFVFSDDQSYMLAFTHRRMRVYKDGALVLGPPVGPITAVNEVLDGGNFYVELTVASHGVSDYDEIRLSGMNGGFPNGDYVIEAVSTNVIRVLGKQSTFTSSPGSFIQMIAGCPTPYRAYDDGVANTTTPSDLLVYDKLTQSGLNPFTRPEFLEFQYAQANDVMYIVHRTCAPRKLVRVSDLGWSCNTYTRTPDPFTSANYPQAITFFEQRLIYGGLKDAPQAIRGSQSGSFDAHTTGTNDSDAIAYTAAQPRLAAIRTLVGNEDFLTIGTSEGSLRMQGGGNGDALTPTSVLCRQIDADGVAAIPPVLINQNPVYVRKDLQKILSLQFNPAANRYLPEDLNKYSDEILRGKARKMAYQRGTPNILWIATQSGELLGLNLDSNERVLGWHTHKTEGIVMDVATIPIAEGKDDVYLIVNRSIDGEDQFYIEILTRPQEYPRRQDYFTGTTAAAKATDEAAYRGDLLNLMKQAFHVDCGLSRFGSPVTTVTGLGHLEGKEVAVVVDGKVHPRRTVTSGAITLAYSGSWIHVGLPYTGIIKTNNLEPGVASGPVAGLLKNVTKFIVRFLDTGSAKYGTDPYNLETINFREQSHALNDPPMLFTGDRALPAFDSSAREKYCYVVQDQPEPCTVVMIAAHVDAAVR